MELVGEQGTIYVDAFNQKIEVFNNQAPNTKWLGFGDDANLALIQEFVNAVEEHRQPFVTGEDGLRAVEITIAAYRSAASAKKIRV